MMTRYVVKTGSCGSGLQAAGTSKSINPNPQQIFCIIIPKSTSDWWTLLIQVAYEIALLTNLPMLFPVVIATDRLP